MFGSIVLEVLIGLVLVYLLLSLVGSTIQEAIAAKLNWRGKMLRDAVARLFDEELPSENGGEMGAWTGNIYEHALIDALQKDGDRPPSYIPNAAFADALIDRLVRTEAMSMPLSPTDRWVRVLRALDTAQAATLSLQPKTASALALLAERARQRVDASAPDAVQRMLDAFKAEICSWYENTMNRTTGWYRRKTQFAQFWIAGLAVIATNADTLMISEQLASDPKAREATVAAATKFLEQNGSSSPTQSGANTTSDGSNPTPSESNPTSGGADARAQIQGAVEQLRKTAAEAQLEIGWPDPVRSRLKEEKRVLDETPAPTLTPAEAGALEKRRDKVESGLGWWWSRKFIGLAITICAVALGAPFWFQMLQKLVNVRSSGAQITGGDAAAATKPGSGEPTAPVPGAEVSVAVGSSGAAATSVVAVATVSAAEAAEKLDERYWTNFVERWKNAKRTTLPPSNATDSDALISAFLARMAALAYEPEWTIRGWLAKLGVAVEAPAQFKFCDEKGTQAFAFKLGPDVVVAFRGTEPSKIEDIVADAHFALSARLPRTGRIHAGFAKALDYVFDELDRWIDKALGENGRVFLTGHSLGAALATLHFDRRVAKPQSAIQLNELVTFGSPRVGDGDFCAEFETHTASKSGEKRKTRVLRFVNNRDLVTRVAPRSMKFDHVGAEIYIDSDGRVHTGEDGGKKWFDFTLLVVDGLVEFKAAAKKPVGDHSMDLYVRRLENWTDWKV